MNNKDKIILHLCAETGSDSKEYFNNGYDVRIITKEIDVRKYSPPNNVYGIIANPPCTMFSIARNDKTAKEKRNFRKGMELVEACLHIIWKCRYNNKLKFWVLENPRGFLRQFLGLPAMTYYAYEYGDLWSKPTDLWGYFNKPKKKYKKDYYSLNFLDKDRIKKTIRNPEKRALCPPGFVKAFYESNK